MKEQFDSILFDMDGTLWDAVDSYAAVWNRSIQNLGIAGVLPVTRKELSAMMGKPLDEIFNRIIGEHCPQHVFMAELERNEAELMPRLGGKLYPGVKDTVAALAQGRKLIMVSNCTELGLPNFLEFTGLKPYFTDAVSFGDTGREKDYNIRLMVEKHGLRSPLYVGDTAGDCRCSKAAGVPFAWAAYGFGRDVEGYDYRLDSFADLLPIVNGNN